MGNEDYIFKIFTDFYYQNIQILTEWNENEYA